MTLVAAQFGEHMITCTTPGLTLPGNRVLILRTSDRDGRAYNGFRWPKSGPVSCPDWDVHPRCGGGLHGFLWGWGDPDLVTHSDGRWILVDAAADEVVDMGDKVKVPRCEVVYCGTRQGAALALWDAGVRGISVAASPIVARFAWTWWADLDVEARASLLLTLPAILGRDYDTSDAAEAKRGLMVADWAIRVFTPAWLECGGLAEDAAVLRGLAPIASWDDVEAAAPALRSARAKAEAAWSAAESAAWSAAARSAAWSAAWSASWLAAESAESAESAAAAAAAAERLRPTREALMASARGLIIAMMEARP